MFLFSEFKSSLVNFIISATVLARDFQDQDYILKAKINIVYFRK